jgi:hypothetical protein
MRLAMRPMKQLNMKISLLASHDSFLLPKNLILPLIKNSVRKNRNFSSPNFRRISVFRNQSCISRQKKIRFLVKGKTGNPKGEKETQGAEKEIITKYVTFSLT